MRSFLLLIVTLFFISNNILGQENNVKALYIHIPNSNYRPNVSSVKSEEKVNVNFSQKALNEVFERYKILSFKQAFPNGKSEKVKCIYIVEYVENEDQFLYKELVEKFSDKFPVVEEYQEPTILGGSPPNDYGIIPSGDNSHLELINIRGAWDVTQGDPDVIIGVADTYLETTHSDLSSEIVSVLNNGSSTSSIAYHGTAVAGLATAATNNGNGFSASGFNTKLMFNTMGISRLLDLSNAGAKVVNASFLTSCTYSSTHKAVIDDIESNGTLLVSAAGNHTGHCGALENETYPCAYENVLCVTSVGHIHDVGYVDPTYGANNWKGVHEEIPGTPSSAHHHFAEVDICAAGFNVASTSPGDTYSGFWGTSFASPTVAGVCGLIFSVNPCFTPDEVIDIVKNTADGSIYSIPANSAYTGLLGAGLLDATAALEEAKKQTSEYVQDETITTTQTRSSYYGVYVGYSVTDDVTYGNVSINSSGSLTLEANHEVVLSGGLEVDGGELIIDLSSDVPNSCGF